MVLCVVSHYSDTTSRLNSRLKLENERTRNESSQIQVAPDPVKMAEMYKWEYQAIRDQRNDLLYKSDWTQIPGGPLSDEKKAEWATYRQQLRDLVIEGSCPLDFVWPTSPQ